MKPREADSALSLGFLKMVNLRLSGLYLFTQEELWSDHAVYGLGDMGDDTAEPVVIRVCGWQPGLQGTRIVTQDGR